MYTPNINDVVFVLRIIVLIEIASDFMVAILSKKLEVHTHTEWEISLGNKRESTSRAKHISCWQNAGSRCG